MLLGGLFLPGGTGKFWLITVCYMISNLGQYCFYLVMMISILNTVEYNEYKRGVRDEAIIASLRPFLTKMSSAVVAALTTVGYLIFGVTSYTNQISALEQQSAPASLTEFSLDEQLRQVILRLEPTWSARGISWQLDLNSVTVVSDEELLSHVWMNIIQNAIKFSPENAVIEVRVFATDTATVEITDHGIGMDDATVKRIFDRFYQADRSRKQEGVGLGLCLVKRILDMLGGTVSVDSRPGEGSTFRVHVPFRPKYDEAAHTDEREGKSP